MGTLWGYRDKDFELYHSLDRRPKPEDYFLHAHEKHEIYGFLSGDGRYLVEGTEYPLEPGSLLFMRAGETHKLQIRPDKPYERITLHFSPHALRAIDGLGWLTEPFTARPLGCGNLYARAHMPNGQALMYLQNMLIEEADGYARELAIRTYLPPLLTEVRHVFLQRETDAAPEHRDISRELVEYINENLCGDLTLDALADHFFLSKSQLGRLFRKATGSPIWEYVLIKRLLAARGRIRGGEAAGEVCQSCGFREYSSFYRAYKKRFGVSPREDRP